LESELTLEIYNSLVSVEDFIGLMAISFPNLRLQEMTKLYSETGNELKGDDIILLKDKDVVYYDPKGASFNVHNILCQYEILGELGKGGFGTVYKAKHKKTGELVSIKYIDITEFCKL